MDNITHFEIPVINPERATEFYSSIFGWKITKWQGNIPYWTVTTVETDENMMPIKPGAINGGLILKKDNREPVVVINVESIDEKIETVKEMGGDIIMEKRSIGDMGFYARIIDSEGNVIGLWENKKK